MNACFEDAAPLAYDAAAGQMIIDALNRIMRGEPDPPCPYGCPPESHYEPVRAPQQAADFVIYAFIGHDDACLYVGQTRDLAKRVYDHLRHYEPFAFHAREVVIVDKAETRADAHVAERAAIQRLNPRFNIVHSMTNHFGQPLPAPTVVSGRTGRRRTV